MIGRKYVIGVQEGIRDQIHVSYNLKLTIR